MMRFIVLSLVLVASLLCGAVASGEAIPHAPILSTPVNQPSVTTSLDSSAASNVNANVELRAAPPQHASLTTLVSAYQPLARAAEETETETETSKLLGYTYTFGTYSPWHCHSGTYFAVSGYARCCEKDLDCPVFTACTDTSVMKNDKYRMTCNGTSSQSVCVTGTIFESIGDLNPRLYINCWSNWTDGDWKATRTTSLNETAAGNNHGDSIGKGPLAGIILGALVGLILLVAFGVFAARVYARMTRTLVVLEKGARESSLDDSSDDAEKGVKVEVTPLERVFTNTSPHLHIPLRYPLEVSAAQMDPHEMEPWGVQRPGSVRTATGSEAPYVDAPEYH